MARNSPNNPKQRRGPRKSVSRSRTRFNLSPYWAGQQLRISIAPEEPNRFIPCIPSPNEAGCFVTRLPNTAFVTYMGTVNMGNENNRQSTLVRLRYNSQEVLIGYDALIFLQPIMKRPCPKTR